MSDIQKKNPTYAERQQRKAELFRESNRAMETGNLELVKKHFKAGRYDLGARNSQETWQNRAHEFASAAHNGHIPLIDFFIEQGGSISQSGGVIVTAAAKNNQIAMLEHLISKGASDYSITTAFRDAASKGHLQATELLLDAGAMIYSLNERALYDASKFGHAEVVKLLGERGADMNVDDQKPFKLAVENNNDATVKVYIIDLKIELTPENKQWLIENKHSYALKLLEKRELNERLSQKYSQPAKPASQSKGPSWKI